MADKIDILLNVSFVWQKGIKSTIVSVYSVVRFYHNEHSNQSEVQGGHFHRAFSAYQVFYGTHQYHVPRGQVVYPSHG